MVLNTLKRASAADTVPPRISPPAVSVRNAGAAVTATCVPLGTSTPSRLMLVTCTVVVLSPSANSRSGLATTVAVVGRLPISVPGATAVVK